MQQSPPPQAPEAEDAVLGAILTAAAYGVEKGREVASRAVGAGLTPERFYRETNGKLWRAATELLAGGQPCDPIVLVGELERRGELEEVGGRSRVHELVALTPTLANVEHYAAEVVEAWQRRRTIMTAAKIAQLGWNGYDRAKVAELAAELREHTATGGRFRGISHAEALAREVTATRALVEGLVEAGTPGTIAGLPATHKSFLALALALRVTTGGRVLDREVLHTGPAAYWWQDDSEANELGRIQEYARRHGLTDDGVRLRWHLNEGLRLPRDLAALRSEIEREGQVLVVLDSLYNFLGGVRLKDEEVAGVLDAIKHEVCDPTGCTIAFVDHAPWPTEDNRGQRRAYGSVFKTAAIRWSVFLEREGEALFVQASGNNLPGGMPRTAVLWDADRLELRPVPPPSRTGELADAIEDFVRRNPGATTSVVRAGVTGADSEIDRVLADDPRFESVPPAMFRKPRNATCWVLAEDVPSLLNTTSAESAADVAPTLGPVTDDNVGANHLGGDVVPPGSPPTLGVNPGGAPAEVDATEGGRVK